QWQTSTTGTGSWSNATGTGSTAATYTPPSSVAGTLFYRVLINALNSGCDQAVSSNASATIVPDISVQTQPTSFNECVGGTGTLSVVITGGTERISYQWQSSPSGANTWSNATGTGSTSSVYTPPSITPGVVDYRVLINA